MVKKSTLLALAGVLVFSAAVQAQQAGAKLAAPTASAAKGVAPAASVPAVQPAGGANGSRMRQVQAACRKKVSDAGLTGEAAKKAIFDCMRNPA